MKYFTLVSEEPDYISAKEFYSREIDRLEAVMNECRDKLEDKNHITWKNLCDAERKFKKFKSHDPELILHLLDEYYIDCINLSKLGKEYVYTLIRTIKMFNTQAERFRNYNIFIEPLTRGNIEFADDITESNKPYEKYEDYIKRILEERVLFHRRDCLEASNVS